MTLEALDRRREPSFDLTSANDVDDRASKPPTTNPSPATPDYDQIASYALPFAFPPSETVPLDQRSSDILKSEIDAQRTRLDRRAYYPGRAADLEGVTLAEAELVRRQQSAMPGDIGALARARGFCQLSPETQRAVMALPSNIRGVLAEELDHHGGDKAAATTIAQLALCPGFQLMTSPEQERLLHYVGGKNDELSAPARATLASGLKAPLFTKGTAKQQYASLQTFVSKQPGLRDVDFEADGTWTANATAKMSPPTTVPAIQFSSGVKPAQRYEVEVDGRKISVVVSAQAAKPGFVMASREDVRRALERMPKAARDKVNVVQLDSRPSPSDPYYQKQYKNPDHHAYMTAGAHGVLTIHPTTSRETLDTIAGAMTHEAGHFDSIARFGSNADGKNADPRWKPWKNAIASDRLSASAYAKVAPEEDFAETYRLYAESLGTPRHAELRKIMPERFRILDTIWNTP